MHGGIAGIVWHSSRMLFEFRKRNRQINQIVTIVLRLSWQWSILWRMTTPLSRTNITLQVYDYFFFHFLICSCTQYILVYTPSCSNHPLQHRATSNNTSMLTGGGGGMYLCETFLLTIRIKEFAWDNQFSMYTCRVILHVDKRSNQLMFDQEEDEGL